MYDEAALNDYSRNFARLLFKKFPEWQGYISTDPDDYEDSEETDFLMVKVPRWDSKEPDPLDILWISTEDDEITLGFDRFHTHFGLADEPEEETFKKALQFIEWFLDEQMMIAVRMQGDRWLGSTCVRPDEEFPRQKEQYVYYKSWYGTYDHRDQ